MTMASVVVVTSFSLAIIAADTMTEKEEEEEGGELKQHKQRDDTRI